MLFSAFLYALPPEVHRLIAIEQLLCPDVTGLDRSNLAAMFGAGGGLGELPGGVPPVQDPETAYASELTQLQARCSHNDTVLQCETSIWKRMHTYLGYLFAVQDRKGLQYCMHVLS